MVVDPEVDGSFRFPNVLQFVVYNLLFINKALLVINGQVCGKPHSTKTSGMLSPVAFWRLLMTIECLFHRCNEAVFQILKRRCVAREDWQESCPP